MPFTMFCASDTLRDIKFLLQIYLKFCILHNLPLVKLIRLLGHINHTRFSFLTGRIDWKKKTNYPLA